MESSGTLVRSNSIKAKYDKMLTSRGSSRLWEMQRDWKERLFQQRERLQRFLTRFFLLVSIPLLFSGIMVASTSPEDSGALKRYNFAWALRDWKDHLADEFMKTGWQLRIGANTTLFKLQRQLELFPDPLMSDGRERDPEASRSQHASIYFTRPGILATALDTVLYTPPPPPPPSPPPSPPPPPPPAPPPSPAPPPPPLASDADPTSTQGDENSGATLRRTLGSGGVTSGSDGSAQAQEDALMGRVREVAASGWRVEGWMMAPRELVLLAEEEDTGQMILTRSTISLGPVNFVRELRTPNSSWADCKYKHRGRILPNTSDCQTFDVLAEICIKVLRSPGGKWLGSASGGGLGCHVENYWRPALWQRLDPYTDEEGAGDAGSSDKGAEDGGLPYLVRPGVVDPDRPETWGPLNLTRFVVRSAEDPDILAQASADWGVLSPERFRYKYGASAYTLITLGSAMLVGAIVLLLLERGLLRLMDDLPNQAVGPKGRGALSTPPSKTTGAPGQEGIGATSTLGLNRRQSAVQSPD